MKKDIKLPPISKKSNAWWNPPTTAIISSDNMQNVYYNGKGCIKKIGYKTFKQMVKQLKYINKLNKKFNFKAVYTITLPLN